MGENLADSELVSIVNGTETVCGEPVTLLHAPHVWQFVFDER
jgi:hypothetical protein